jgi:hypothetical protein
MPTRKHQARAEPKAAPAIHQGARKIILKTSKAVAEWTDEHWVDHNWADDYWGEDHWNGDGPGNHNLDDKDKACDGATWDDYGWDDDDLRGKETDADVDGFDAVPTSDNAEEVGDIEAGRE